MAKKKIEIDKDEFPSVSIAPTRETKRTVEFEETPTERRRPIVTKGNAVIKKKGIIASIASLFVGGTENVGSYILYDILLPAAKNTIQEMITSGIDMLLNGAETPSSRRIGRERGRTQHISYGNYYDPRSNYRRDASAIGARRDRFDLDSIFFRHGQEASDVLELMGDRMEMYGWITVADYYDLCGVEGASWALQKYGWNDLATSFIRNTREGYLIVLPDPKEIDRHG